MSVIGHDSPSLLTVPIRLSSGIERLAASRLSCDAANEVETETRTLVRAVSHAAKCPTNGCRGRNALTENLGHRQGE
jgi:hypothetical protein